MLRAWGNRTTAGIVLGACLAWVGCIQVPVRLDVPLRYRDVPPGERIRVPCYYSLDAATQGTVLTEFMTGYHAELGPGISEQLRVALFGLCRGSGRVQSREEFRALSADKPAVLFEVHAAGRMEPAPAWGPNTSTGSVFGTAVVVGATDDHSRQYMFTGSGLKRERYAEKSGGEGLRRALRSAVQHLVDQAAHDRVEIEQLAHLPG